jgi:hypothetical protein
LELARLNTSARAFLPAARLAEAEHLDLVDMVEKQQRRRLDRHSHVSRDLLRRPAPRVGKADDRDSSKIKESTDCLFVCPPIGRIEFEWKQSRRNRIKLCAQ